MLSVVTFHICILHGKVYDYNVADFDLKQILVQSKPQEVIMSYKSKYQKVIFICLAVMLTIACNALTRISPFSSVPAATTVVSSTLSPSSFKPGDPTATPLGSEITEPNYIKGVEALLADNYEEALVLLSAAIEANPNLAPPYQYRGLVYWYLDDCVSGLADEEKALSINPNYAAAWGRRGLLYSCLGDDQRALQDYQKALSIDPSLAFIHHNLGYYYFLQGDYEKSLDEYTLGVEIDPNRSATWSGKVHALTQMGRYDECITEATRALEINPEDGRAYGDRGYCELVMNNYPTAIDDFKKSLEFDPTDVNTWNNLGVVQRRAGLADDAINSLSQALELEPSYYESNINRGLAYIDLGKYDEALEDFNRALEFGDIPAAYSGRGSVYYFLGRYDEAVADLKLATQMMPNSPSSYCFLSLTYFETERYQDSLDAAAIVNQLEPGCGGQRLLEYQARSYYGLGDYEQAIAYINKAFAMGPYTLGFYYQGIIYDDAGRDAEATLWLRQFLLSVQDEGAFAKEIADAKQRLAKLEP